MERKNPHHKEQAQKQPTMQEEMKSLDSYTSFAYVYDTFMDQEPYDHWADRVCAFLDEFGLPRTADTSATGNGNPCAETDGRPESTGNSAEEEAGSNESNGNIAEEEAGGRKSAGGSVEKEAGGRKSAGGSVEEEAGGRKSDGNFIAEERNIVVDLGCGTGKLTEIMARRGYDMIGIDLSEDMLAIAQERKIKNGSSTLYSLQDMRDFELYGAAGSMISVGDSINYLLEEKDLEDMFRCVARGLLPGGVFVFDFKTIHLYRDIIGDRTIAEDRGDCAFIWDNYYDSDTCINEYDLAVFVRASGEEKNRDRSLFRRFDEVHQQRGYEPEQLRQAAESAGLEWVTARDADTGSAVSGMTERVMAAVRKTGPVTSEG